MFSPFTLSSLHHFHVFPKMIQVVTGGGGQLPIYVSDWTATSRCTWYLEGMLGGIRLLWPDDSEARQRQLALQHVPPFCFPPCRTNSSTNRDGRLSRLVELSGWASDSICLYCKQSFASNALFKEALLYWFSSAKVADWDCSSVYLNSSSNCKVGQY